MYVVWPIYGILILSFSLIVKQRSISTLNSGEIALVSYSKCRSRILSFSYSSVLQLVNGTLPVSSSKISNPKDHTSVLGPYRLPISPSGLI